MSFEDLYFARHGEADSNVRGIMNGHMDDSLTNRGVYQADCLRAQIRKTGIRFKHLFASPLKRAYHTACIAGHPFGLKPTVIHALKERDFGPLTGKPIAELERICGSHVVKTLLGVFVIDFPGVESLNDLRYRAHDALGEMLDIADGQPFMVVAHGGIGEALRAAYLDMPWPTPCGLFRFPNAELVRISHAQLSLDELVSVPA